MARVGPQHAALLIGLVHLALVLFAIVPRPHEGGDNASYLALARSLREHGTYQELWDPAARAHTQYPPGWPLMLAAAMTVGIDSWVGFKMLAALFSAGAVALAYLWARRVSTPGTALAVGVLLAVGTGVVNTGRWELSDSAFWAFTMLALLGFARLQEREAERVAPPPAQGGRWQALRGPLALAAVATLLAYATRSAGLPLVVAGGAWLVWRRRWRQLAAFALVIAPFAVFWWARGRMAGGPGYVSYLWNVNAYRPMDGTVGVMGLLARIGRNTVEYATMQTPFLLTGVGIGRPAQLLGAGVVLLALAGWAMRMRRVGVAELWLPLYMGLVLIWPAEWATDRFLLPALPMLLVCAAEPVRLLGARTGRAALVGTAATAIIVLAATPPLVRLLGDSAKCRAQYTEANPFPCLPQPRADFLQLARALRGRLPADAAVLSRKPTLFWAYAGYPSRTYPFTDNPDTLLAAAREAGARYLVVDYMDELSTLYLGPVLMQRPQAFCAVLAGELGGAALMGIVPGAESMPNLRARPGDETADVPFSTCGPEFWAQAP
jgi:4-amino-4-deoxy-L-arabinose transferase-like glycosyltransferase